MTVEIKILLCANCGEPTEHSFKETKAKKYQYFSRKEGCEKNGDGIKDIWECRKCGEARIYGAPTNIVSHWTMAEEKRHVAAILKDFGNSRAIIFCPTPGDWVAAYMRGLDRRYYGFKGNVMEKREKTELKIFALKELKKIENKPNGIYH